MRKWILAGLFVLALVAPAGGAEDPGPTVAAAGRLELHARLDGRDLCLKLLVAGDGAGRSCGRVPTAGTVPVELTGGGAEPYAAAVDPSVASVGLERASGEERYDTVAADGFEARFALIEAPGRIRLVRFYGADGTLLGASATGRTIGGPGNRAVVRVAPRLRLKATSEYELAPVPGALDRVVARACLEGRAYSRRGLVCSPPYGAPLAQLDSVPGCAPRRDFVFGLTRAPVDRIELVLGDGRRVRTAARALPEAYGGRSAVGVLLPPGTAVRLGRALDREGRSLGRIAFNLPPGGPCDEAEPVRDTGFGSDELTEPEFDPPPATVAEPAGVRLLAADAGDELCVGFRRLYGYSCQPPPLDGTYPSLEWSGRALGGVVAGSVATLTVVFTDGSTGPVELGDGPAYAGRYAGAVRFASLTLPDGKTPKRVVARDAGGRRLGATAVEAPFSERLVRVLAGRRRSGAVLTRFTGERRLCVQPRVRGYGLSYTVYCERDDSYPYATVAVGCAPRQTVIVGALTPGARGVRLRLTGGRTVKARTAHGLWGVAIGKRRGVRSITIGGRDPVAVRVLPASRQCGYAGSLSL